MPSLAVKLLALNISHRPQLQPLDCRHAMIIVSKLLPTEFILQQTMCGIFFFSWLAMSKTSYLIRIRRLFINFFCYIVFDGFRSCNFLPLCQRHFVADSTTHFLKHTLNLSAFVENLFVCWRTERQKKNSSLHDAGFVRFLLMRLNAFVRLIERNPNQKLVLSGLCGSLLFQQEILFEQLLKYDGLLHLWPILNNDVMNIFFLYVNRLKAYAQQQNAQRNFALIVR